MAAVGFVGLGAMGSSIVSNLLDNGVDVVVWNRSRAPIATMVARGARAASCLQEALEQPVSFSMLSNDDAVADVLTQDALAAAAERTHVCMASISPRAADRLEKDCLAQDVSYVGAPVLGRPEVAARGELNIVTAGRHDVVESVQPIFDIIGCRTWRVGSTPRTANLFKVVVNYNIIHALQAMGESAAVLEAHGGSSGELVDLLSNTMFGGVVHRVYGPMIADRSYWPAGFTLELGRKDLELAAVSAAEASIELPSVAVLRAQFDQALADASLGGADWSALADTIRSSPPTN